MGEASTLIDPLHPWARARLCLELLTAEPRLGGMWLRARAGPVRARFLEAIPLDVGRLHPAMADEALDGGLDLGATLAAGRMVHSAGALRRHTWHILTMAERCEPHLAARLARAVEDGGKVLIALDEGVGDGEGLPSALTDRLAFHIELDGLRLGELPNHRACTLGPRPELPAERLRELVEISAAFGVFGLRSLRQATLTAVTLARRDAAMSVSQAHVARAAELVIAPRALQMPAFDDQKQDAQPRQDRPTDGEQPPGDDRRDGAIEVPEELLLEAVKAAIPPGLLARLAQEKSHSRSGGASGSGGRLKGNRRGRPLTPRAGRLDGRSRIDLVSTLRAAAPWQPIRRKLSGDTGRLQIRQSDVRLKRYEERSDRLLIFTVDASGSAALARLAEAKGAVELLLAEAYARRDYVSLVSFRGVDAELLLPPTRSLVQTKRRLAALPGGGGTPLAAGLHLATKVGLQARARGMTPTVALLTDGRANVTLAGMTERTQARAEARDMASQIRRLALSSLVIDMGKRPERSLSELAALLSAPYVPLPRANARGLSQVVATATQS
ncbi:MAG: magnesium chelatase subunit D [Pseudomonadota bacterium]